LVKMVAPRIKSPAKNKSCIRPIPYGDADNPDRVDLDCERAWRRKKPAVCCIYDVKNLIDALPIGGPTLASVGNDTPTNAYIALAGAFYGVQQQHLTGGQLAMLMKQQSQEGSTPLKSVTIIGHSWAINYKIGGIDPAGGENQVFRLRDLLRTGPYDNDYAEWPNWTDAIQGKRPPLCWLRTDAQVRLVGCITSNFANYWASEMLRGTAIAWGTKRPTWAFPGRMGWGRRARGGVWQWDGGETARTPAAYHQMPYWAQHNAAN
jgi:hypothetical protein